jgi:hypothetical protein
LSILTRPRCRFAAAILIVLAAACGKKGPPLAPLNMGPEAPQALIARRLADTVYLQFKVPAKSAVGAGPYSVDHLDVYAVTLAPGMVLPANRFVLKNENVVGRVDVRPPIDPDEDPEEPAAGDPRPHPGDTATFTETITAAQLVPFAMPAAAAPAPASGGPPRTVPTAGAAPAGVAAPGVPPATPPPAATGVGVLTRLYIVQGVAKNGNKGAPSPRVNVPLLAAPGPARPGAAATYDASSVTISWNPPLTSSDEAPGVSYNVYSAASSANGAPATVPAPLNDTPLTVTTFAHAGAEAGKEQCFVVRSVATVENATIESAPSEPICVTPKDTFPPSAPKGLAAVSGTGAINLIWDANSDADLGGYLVLRAEAPSDTLQPLTPQPIRETRYRDTTVTPGVRYVYAVIAVDRAAPPNRSAPSNRVEETAR